jgi:hypothetical protein
MPKKYTIVFYARIVKLYERMPAKKVAKMMHCAESTVRSARHRLKIATFCNVSNMHETVKLIDK